MHTTILWWLEALKPHPAITIPHEITRNDVLPAEGKILQCYFSVRFFTLLIPVLVLVIFVSVLKTMQIAMILNGCKLVDYSKKMSCKLSHSFKPLPHPGLIPGWGNGLKLRDNLHTSILRTGIMDYATPTLREPRTTLFRTKQFNYVILILIHGDIIRR